MKKIIFAIALLLGASTSFAQIVQFSQLPVSLNPSLAGSADAMRVAVGTSYFDYKFPEVGHLSKYSVSLLSFDKFIPKLKSGIGFYSNIGFLNSENDFATYMNQRSNSSAQLGLCISPKFSVKNKTNPNLVKTTWSPSIEINYRAMGVSMNSENSNGNRIGEAKLLGSALGFRIGLSRIGKNSVLGFAYGYQSILGSPSSSIMQTYRDYDSLGTYIEKYENEDIKFKQVNSHSFVFHYGISINLNKSKSLSLIPQVILSLNNANWTSGVTRIKPLVNADALNLVTNVRYKRFLAGYSYILSDVSGGYYGYSYQDRKKPMLSLGYQSSKIKLMFTSNFSYYGELTCSYTFK